MPFGKYCPVEKHTPAGYSGLFWGTVYGKYGERIANAQDYFRELAEENGVDGFIYEDEISDALEEHCEIYIDPYCGIDYNYQSGFGGDDCDGLVDFWTEKPIPTMPPMYFKICKRIYVMKFEYSSGSEEDEDECEDEDEESETEFD